MSQQKLGLSLLPLGALVEAVALGNPLQLIPPWIPIDSTGHSRSELMLTTWDSPDGPPDGADISFVIDPDPEVFGTGAAVHIRYPRNRDVLECAENTALDGEGTPLDKDTIELILDRVQPKQGARTTVDFKTLPEGSLSVKANVGPFYPDARVLASPSSLPSVLLSSLRRTHKLSSAPHVCLVKTISDAVSDDVRVFKRCTHEFGLDKELQFMTRLPDVDFVLRPTHLVLDEAGLVHGTLSDAHPASSLSLTMERLHPLAFDGSGWLAGTTPSVSWLVKLGWATDVAAAVAWLHAQSIVWGDLKTDNIVLCKDGHCRLIDYCPGGYTLGWCAPEVEAELPHSKGSVKGDIFALGLVLWCIAMEVPTVDTGEEDTVRLPLEWSEGIPGWFQTLVSSCVEDEPGRRPSAWRVYESLLASG
ncbi:kinase-like domain-containing protein [Mycena alexandri]|uniref:Kinase-like domain-containing protein n=1 Tax=Mycena alexandri TaxID=1745969 RepID=A0AAD6S7E6_9AGAR|nr:kinase-like domain-containing protein [Mycena alexandri]